MIIAKLTIILFFYCSTIGFGSLIMKKFGSLQKSQKTTKLETIFSMCN